VSVIGGVDGGSGGRNGVDGLDGVEVRYLRAPMVARFGLASQSWNASVISRRPRKNASATSRSGLASPSLQQQVPAQKHPYPCARTDRDRRLHVELPLDDLVTGIADRTPRAFANEYPECVSGFAPSQAAEPRRRAANADIMLS
jgi:hypothetical protein